MKNRESLCKTFCYLLKINIIILVSFFCVNISSDNFEKCFENNLNFRVCGFKKIKLFKKILTKNIWIYLPTICRDFALSLPTPSTSSLSSVACVVVTISKRLRQRQHQHQHYKIQHPAAALPNKHRWNQTSWYPKRRTWASVPKSALWCIG